VINLADLIINEKLHPTKLVDETGTLPINQPFTWNFRRSLPGKQMNSMLQITCRKADGGE
jgi:hypothetical protein